MNKQSMAGTFSQPHERIRLRLTGRSKPYDPRANAIRNDLADVAEANRHFAPHYAVAVAHGCVAPWAMVTGRPDDAASAVTQILHGETFHVIDVRAGWAWGYCGHDHYVGYVRVDALSRDERIVPTHRVGAPGAPLFADANIKTPVVQFLPGGALVGGVEDGNFLACRGGYLHVRHAVPLDTPASDWVEVARAALGQPYVWGGRGGGGLDCSGLVQTALAACGHAVARDTDQQAGSIGVALDPAEPLARGDIVFFPGHVGIMTDGDTLLHANAHWMRVVEEPLADVVARLAPNHPDPITARRRIVT